jgi:hypothetical protein
MDRLSDISAAPHLCALGGLKDGAVDRLDGSAGMGETEVLGSIARHAKEYAFCD